MNYITKTKKKELFSDLQQRHGHVTKLLDVYGQPFGYVVRCEAKHSPGDHPVVLFNISFNKNYEEKEDNIKSFFQSDLKFFTIKKALDYDVSKMSCRSERTPFVLEFKANDDNYFKLGAKTIVDSFIDGATMSGCFFGMSLSHDEQVKESKSTAEYILSKVLSVAEYYKNKDFTLLFI